MTHESNEQCKNPITELKAVGGCDEKRYHTCLKSMADGAEIAELLNKIDSMVSDNSHQCFGATAIRHNADEEQENRKFPNKENVDSSTLLCSGEFYTLFGSLYYKK